MTDTEQGYCRLHLSQYGRVDGVCMLSPVPLSERNNFISLYNVHQSYLNNLLQRFDEGLITDLFRYVVCDVCVWVCDVLLQLSS